ncbi:MAG: GGDEF domain-containing protein, partial [Clostridium sp.]|nr:GGDEF domain-containing protein [Clostridium sp.]
MVINFFTTLFFAHARVFIVMIAVISICILDNIIISFMKYRDQKKFMKDLVIERQRYEMIIEQLDELIVDCNATTKQIITSSQFKKTFGTAHTYLDVTDENPSIYINDKNILDNIKNTSDELFIEKIRLRNRNGHYSWYSIKLKYLYQNKKLVRVIGKIIDIDDSINKYNALKFESEHDLLTQLYNKTAFIKHSENYIAEHIASHSVLFFIDLDNFKSINDNLGHLYGDKVLKETASKLCSIFDYTDIISRFGGDEFCIFSPDVSSLED